MRTVTALLATTLLGGCAKDLKPQGPVLTPYERSMMFSATEFSKVTYLGEPYTDVPVLPFMAFGAAFDVDVVLGLKSDDWDMIEIARMQVPDDQLGSRSQWMVLESRAGSKEQYIVSNVEDIQTWMPELPLGRKGGAQALRVEDRTTSDGLDLQVTYTNVDNEAVELTLQGEPPEKGAKKRNGNTMGHSANSLLAVLDVSSTNSLFKADARINDQKVRTRKIAGIVPFQFILTQAQGGIATGEYFQEVTGAVKFADGESVMSGTKWEPPAPPPAPPTIPEPANVPDGVEVMIVGMDKWVAIADKKAEKAIAEQEAKLDACLTAALAADPDYAGLVVADFYVLNGQPWQITIDEKSTGSDLSMQCVQQIIQSWKMDEKLEGSIQVELARFPYGYETEDEFELEYLKTNPPAPPPEEEKAEDDELPEEGEEDLLGDEEDMDEAPAEPVEKMLSTFQTVHSMANGDKVAQGWDVMRRGGRVYVVQDSVVRKMTYEFLLHGDALELRSIQVENWGSPTPTFITTFSPALPDLGRPFSGSSESQFVMDVGGGQSHATGKIVVTNTGSGPKIELMPTAPNWVEDRPITSEVRFKDGQPFVTTRRDN